MTETADLQRDDVADVADSAPAADAQPVVAPEPKAPADTLDSDLAEFVAGTVRPEPPPAPAQPPPSGDAIDQMLAELNTASAAEQQQLSALQAENSQLRGRIQYETDLADFNKFAGDVQSKLPAYLPDDYASVHFKAMAAENFTLALAFDYRNVDRNAVGIELRKVQIALAQLSRDPYANPQRVASLNAYGARLNVAYHSQQILRQAEREVIKRAQAVPRPIDAEATADKESVAAAVRSAGGKVAVEPPPNLGQLTDRQFREWGRQNVGFDPV
jgi:hypothetical protein